MPVLEGWVRGLAPVGAVGLSTTVLFLSRVLPQEMDSLRGSAAAAGVALAVVSLSLFFMEGALSIFRRGVDFFRWLFLGHAPGCPRCRGRGTRSSRLGWEDAGEMVVTLVCVVAGMLLVI